MIDKKMIQKVADLACLEVTPETSEEFLNHFNKVLDDFECLQEVSTEGVTPMVTPHNLKQDLRPDKVNQKLSVEEILNNAPEVKDDLFKVPPVV